ncbi:unnamed protein product [Candidula unifasciata]|uniref:Receptor ligand binding region domain-containing protein n=1 Tax=Candidula unifasciata TaxID=100452 RepID=A0A8S3YB93_9EUPU|nr:unnamed protein product [Candidula unifasciata]
MSRRRRSSDVISSVPLSTLATGVQHLPSSASDQVQERYFRLVSRLVIPPTGGRASGKNVSVTVGVLLPFSGNRSFDVRKVAPAIETAVEKVTLDMGPWNFHSVTVLYGDSQCDIADSMNQAIQLHERQRTSAFFGPVCDYAIAPVARQARYWNTPLITAGATAFDYYWLKNTTYSTLTRIGPANLQGCSGE